MNKRNKIIIFLISTLTLFILIASFLGILAFSKSHKYYLETSGEVIYCSSIIWMRVNKQNNKIDGSFTCNYKKPNASDKYEYKYWNGEYPDKYFEYEKETN